MPYYLKKDYKFIRFIKSDRQYKKYCAVLENRSNKKLVKVHFGDNRYQHYKDTTGLKDYTHLNHNDPERRRLYRIRHNKEIKSEYYSPGYFSFYYLW